MKGATVTKPTWQTLEAHIIAILDARGFEIMEHNGEPILNLIEGLFSIREFAKQLAARLEARK